MGISVSELKGGWASGSPFINTAEDLRLQLLEVQALAPDLWAQAVDSHRQWLEAIELLGPMALGLIEKKIRKLHQALGLNLGADAASSVQAVCAAMHIKLEGEADETHTQILVG